MIIPSAVQHVNYERPNRLPVHHAVEPISSGVDLSSEGKGGEEEVEEEEGVRQPEFAPLRWTVAGLLDTNTGG